LERLYLRRAVKAKGSNGTGRSVHRLIAPSVHFGFSILDFALAYEAGDFGFSILDFGLTLITL
jgi:hypothetical protein